jgi:hypothetical protein
MDKANPQYQSSQPPERSKKPMATPPSDPVGPEDSEPATVSWPYRIGLLFILGSLALFFIVLFSELIITLIRRVN